ncbi:hypothetical protein BBBOND_0211800 [Babesia bigemina]|uniref:Uncharacterized protein n=1 Tax=Babesia bigemina TaxID=5866 RepID=A0A061D653_BABBI|nr:hypothetical protein BBBOND_0211800 [Babesia bigemina]CDR96038.1 hypothetical protein BBBOND_0211800 [Babesia bigemina]|eukprot:XP_012768224.1 hypothetical protein BBBOND_0211800 [Babesia bigemina]
MVQKEMEAKQKCECKYSENKNHHTKCGTRGKCICCPSCCALCKPLPGKKPCGVCQKIWQEHNCNVPKCDECPLYYKNGCENCKPKVGITAFCLTVLFLLLIVAVMYFFAWKSDPGFKQLRDYLNNGKDLSQFKQ